MSAEVGELEYPFKEPSEYLQNPRIRAVTSKLLQSAMPLSRTDVVIDGIENVPEEGSVIIAPKHVSFKDSLLTGLALEGLNKDDSVRNGREVWFGAKTWFWELKFAGKALGSYLEKLGAIPVNRDGGGMDKFLQDLGFKMECPKLGAIAVVHPTGTRAKPGNPNPPLKKGVAILALDRGIPIVPVGHANTKHAWDPRARSKVVLSFGAPLQPYEQLNGDAEQITDRLGSEIEFLSSRATRISNL